MSETVVFDPGIGQFVQDVNEYVNQVYSQLMNFQSLSQKRTRFRLYYNQIYSKLENNIAFYEGCLLWAYYIKKTNQNTPKDIVGNVFLYLTPEQLENYDFLMMVNFLSNYFDSFERDTQYYLGKKVEIPKKWINILELYKEFLELNKGFVKARTTEDLKLPQKLEETTFMEDINSVITNAIEKKDLSILLSIEL